MSLGSCSSGIIGTNHSFQYLKYSLRKRSFHSTYNTNKIHLVYSHHVTEMPYSYEFVINKMTAFKKLRINLHVIASCQCKCSEFCLQPNKPIYCCDVS